jgi:hypothetical protein
VLPEKEKNRAASLVRFFYYTEWERTTPSSSASHPCTSVEQQALAWIFAAWALPLAVFALALALRALEYVVSAIGFGLTLPWRGQTIDGVFHWSYDHYDIGIWISTFALAAPALLVAWLGWAGRSSAGSTRPAGLRIV